MARVNLRLHKWMIDFSSYPMTMTAVAAAAAAFTFNYERRYGNCRVLTYNKKRRKTRLDAILQQNFVSF